VRGRLEARLPADAAARKQRDALLAEVPGGGLCSVAGIRVLGKQDKERAVEVEAERGDEERKPGLGDASGRPMKLGRERGETLGTGQLEGERLQCRCGETFRLVHDERRNRRFRAGSV
jgi:hypothetical protein